MNLESLFTINYGMYIVSSHYKDKMNGQIANAVMQVTAEPPKIAICVSKNNLTCDLIMKSRVFSISTLSIDAPMPFLGLFGFKSGREIDKFKDIKYKISLTKAPIVLEHTISYFECEMENSLDAGSHVIIVGKVIDAQFVNEGEAMSYNYYRQVRHGTAPKNAPTYIKKNNEDKKEDKVMQKYRCNVCGYIYDPEKGDPDSNIDPGTAFADLPEAWVCPVCGADKSAFELEG